MSIVSGDSVEAVAFALMREVFSVWPSAAVSKEDILATYAECLRVVRTGKLTQE